MSRLASVLLAAGLLAGCSAAAVPGAASARETRPADDRQIVHALSRLTYGPRPGDVERVRAAGLPAWIERQLRPETVDDSVTEEA